MATPRSGVVPRKWSLLRREIERVLADGEWHVLGQLFAQVERYVDPRIAARHWCRDYDQRTLTRGLERESSSEAIRGNERVALRAGAWSVFWDTVREPAKRGHFEFDGPARARRIRLRAQKKATLVGVACQHPYGVNSIGGSGAEMLTPSFPSLRK